MKLIFLILVYFLPFQQAAKEPIPIHWMQLMRVPIRPVTLAGIEGSLPLPVFTTEIKKLDGKMVEIDGYIIPLDKSGKTLALSAYAMAECFFCGKASPASVMTIILKKANTKYKTDQIGSFRGRLRLNDSDPKELFYVLEEGEEVKN